jgi:hypothetical protein
MKNIPELKYWASGQQDTSSILHQTRESSKKEIENTIVDFVLPISDLAKIVGDQSTAEDILREIQIGEQDPFIEVIKTKSGQQVILFKEIRFGKAGEFNKQIGNYLANLAGDESIKQQVTEAVKFYEFDRGHVYGWANTLVKRTQTSIGNTLASRNVPPEQLQQELQALEGFINSLLNVLEQYDEAASSLGSDLKADVFAQYRKTDSSWLIQWQGKAEQQKAGSGVATAIGKSGDKGVRGFLKAVGYQSGDDIVQKAMQGMIKGFLDQGLSDTDKNFLQLESSPKIIELLEDTLMSAATGKPKKYANEYTGKIDLPKLNLQTTVGVSAAKASINRTKQELNKLKTDAKKAQQKIKEQKLLPQASTVNLLNLQNLLNMHIQDVVSANMGDGNRKDILNYRTGRFAASVQIERLLMSREGMITAFYNYMKYPYATFSQGGKQSKPGTRDPKLLISKSIREIASENIANRLRAVVV